MKKILLIFIFVLITLTGCKTGNEIINTDPSNIPTKTEDVNVDTVLSTTPMTVKVIETTVEPTNEPTVVTTVEPTKIPTVVTTVEPTKIPTVVTTVEPTKIPTVVPTIVPTKIPTIVPTVEPTKIPTIVATVEPTKIPTVDPTAEATYDPVPSSIPISEECEVLTDPNLPCEAYVGPDLYELGFEMVFEGDTTNWEKCGAWGDAELEKATIENSSVIRYFCSEVKNNGHGTWGSAGFLIHQVE